MDDSSVYLNNPKNRDFIEGRASAPEGRSLPRAIYIFAFLFPLFFTALGFLFFQSGRIGLEEATELNEQGVDSTGTITSIISRARTDDNPNPGSTGEFDYVVGVTTYKSTFFISPVERGKWRVGQEIPIRYSDSHPYIARVGHGIVPIGEGVSGQLVGVIIMLLGVAGVVGVYQFLIRRQKQTAARLAVEGKLIQGKVSALQRDSEGHIFLKYTFETSDGAFEPARQFFGTGDAAQRVVGKTAYLLYKDKTHYKLL